MVFMKFLIRFYLFYLNQKEKNSYEIKTLEPKGSFKERDNLFKMNYVVRHGLSARGLVGQDLNSITLRLNDRKIIKQVIQGLTPPRPNFDIDSQNMSNSLKYLHIFRINFEEKYS